MCAPLDNPATVSCLQGFIPSNYVKIVKSQKSFFSMLRNRTRKKADSRQQPVLPSLSPSPSLNGQNSVCPSPGCRAGSKLDNVRVITKQLNRLLPTVVKYNYSAQQPDELSLVKGQQVLVMEKSSDGWWRGEQEDHTAGWFPSNYVKVVGDHENILYSSTAGPDDTCDGVQGMLPDTVLALYTFAGGKSGELPFNNGDKLELVVCDGDFSGSDWCRARNSRGDVGLIPCNYVISGNITQDGDWAASTPSSTPQSKSVSSMSNLSLVGPMGRRQFAVSGPLSDRDWYYGKITRQQCEDVLMRHADNGDFLIRDSESTVSKNDRLFMSTLCLFPGD